MDIAASDNTKIVVGLGNPGRKYAGTRHNVGFMVAEALVRKWAFGPGKKAFGGVVYDGRVTEAGDETAHLQRVMLLEPRTYMNCSGQAVKGIMTYYKVDLRDVLIVLDDLALPPGRIRIRPDGSAGGHKGLADVQNLLGTDKMARLRIGIGSPPEYMDAADFVLRTFEQDEAEIIEKSITLAARAVEEWLFNPLDRVMEEFNGITFERKTEDE